MNKELNKTIDFYRFLATVTVVNVLDHTGLVGLVLKANPYLYSNHLMDYEDCFQEGMIALIEATESYNKELGAFSTYACDRIKWHIQRSKRQTADTIRKPERIHEKHYKIKTKARAFEKVHEQAPGMDLLAIVTGLQVEEIERIQCAFEPVKSLQTPITSEGSATLEEVIQDERDDMSKVEHDIFISQLRTDLLNIMTEALSEVDKRLILDYYGFNGKNHTMEQLALKNNLEVSQARNRINNSIRKLGSPKYTRLLLKKYPEIISHQIYSMDVANTIDDTMRNMVVVLFKFYAHVGDTLSINDKISTVTGVEEDYITYSQNGMNYRAPYSDFKDTETKDGKNTRLYIK